jgi:hypothetical protein
VRIAVECRSHRRAQDRTWIDALIGKYANLDVQRVVAVSRSGFTPAATAAAEESNGRIATLTFDNALAHDWQKELGGLTVGLTVTTVQALEADLGYSGSGLGITSDELKQARLMYAGGQPQGTVGDFAKREARVAVSTIASALVRTQPQCFPTEFSVAVRISDDELLIEHAGERRAVVEVQLRVTARVELHPVELRHYMYRDNPITTGEIELDETKFEIVLVQSKRSEVPVHPHIAGQT